MFTLDKLSPVFDQLRDTQPVTSVKKISGGYRLTCNPTFLSSYCTLEVGGQVLINDTGYKVTKIGSTFIEVQSSDNLSSATEIKSASPFTYTENYFEAFEQVMQTKSDKFKYPGIFFFQDDSSNSITQSTDPDSPYGYTGQVAFYLAAASEIHNDTLKASNYVMLSSMKDDLLTELQRGGYGISFRSGYETQVDYFRTAGLQKSNVSQTQKTSFMPDILDVIRMTFQLELYKTDTSCG